MNISRTDALVILFCAALAGLGCSGDGTVDIGSKQAIGAALSDYAATWDGYAEATTFADGSDHVHLTIDTSGQGFITFGDSARPPAPTDPTVGYPPGAAGFGSPGAATPTPLPGFPYPIHSAQVQTDRIQLGVDPNDLYSAWCAIEPPLPNASQSTGYGCLPAFQQAGYDPSSGCSLVTTDGTNEAVDCSKLDLCFMGMVCTCTASGCAEAAVPDGTAAVKYGIALDGALDASGTTLTGTLTTGGATVHLMKQ